MCIFSFLLVSLSNLAPCIIHSSPSCLSVFSFFPLPAPLFRYRWCIRILFIVSFSFTALDSGGVSS